MKAAIGFYFQFILMQKLRIFCVKAFIFSVELKQSHLLRGTGMEEDLRFEEN